MRSPTLALSLFVACGLALSCESHDTAPLAPEGGVLFKPGNGGGKGGGGGGGDLSVTMSVEDAGYRIQSDDGGLYVDDHDALNLRIRDDGSFLINFGGGPRTLTFDFSDPAWDEGDPGDPLAPDCADDCKNQDSYDSGTAASVRVVDVAGDPLANGFLGMVPGGDPLRAEAKFSVDGETRFSLRFRREGADVNVSTESSYVEVRRLFQNVWEVEGVVTGGALNPNAAGDWGILSSSSGRGKKAVTRDEGTYHLPFLMRVECVSDCPDRSP